ncbi:trigger factor (peptidyl-prolyl cis /trans isomerase, chaperone) [Campylobacter blaseri]|uniref:Trigger factor n=1 Tax=Campylobacter blaseri TaxID=2042961 RepID=A0A2P8R0X5_9BACT|nr:trigger factor [Campylobacter blaseri]PSM52147.1 trigger factor [Campylobacter blaseri]PSM53913.1 trigger factor [Campylobacter blaseri]QKF85347.1 trigger factor (peptidyl-prolyl cis /trans isomerase, chaperone) [Campylobacter blaseri]
MKVTSKLLNSANALVEAQLDADSISKKTKEMAQKAAKNVKMDGFRQGKVPVNIVMQRYGKELEEDAKQDLFKEVINEALKELDKKTEDMLGEPAFSKFDEKDGNIDVEMEISFKPELSVEGYEDVIPEYSTPRVTKKEVEEKVKELLTMIAPLEKAEKEALEKGDFAKFDFEGFLDGEPFEGGKAENYVLEIGSNQFIPGFEDEMVGIKVGEEKDVKVTFPKEYQAEHLAGKDVVFKVKLHEIQTKKVKDAIEEEDLKKLMPNEEDVSQEKLEERIKTQIREDKFQKLLYEELKPKFVDAIVEKVTFDLPKTIVEQEIDLQFRNAWNTFSQDDMKKFREDKDALTKKRDEFREEAEKSVKLTFIVDALAKARNVDVSDQEVLQAIYFEAYRSGIDPKEHLEAYKNQGVLPAVKMALIEEKLFNDLFDKSKKEEKGE